MEKIIEELIAIIAKEIEAFNKLLATLHEKQRAIVEGEIDRLNKTVQDESKLADKTKELEANRIERSQELALELSLDNLNPKLSEIIEKVEEKYAQRLSEQRELLRSLIEKIQNLNKNNQYLLNYSLKFIEKSMEALLNGDATVSFYREDGEIVKHKQSKVLDHSI